jgi:aflatoxin B1 aldehyde reductase
LTDASRYREGRGESALGDSGATDGRFIIDTKNYGGWRPGQSLKRENLIKAATESLERLKTKQVDIYYIHGPDDSIPPSEWVPVIDELHKKGLFKRFGLSNYSAKQVREVYDYSKANGYVLPTVYQGNYSPVARKLEFDLFPTLRELGLSFYAYSPLAGGFLTKSRKALEEGAGSGRFVEGALGNMYNEMYIKPAYLEVLDKWEELATKEGVSKVELAYRWVSYHSPLKADLGDGLILGASKVEQISNSIEGLNKGPLSSSAAEAVDDLWKTLEHEAPLDNFHWFKTTNQKSL